MDICAALSSYNLDMKLCPEDIEGNPWFYLLESDLTLLCEKSLAEPVYFTFNASFSVQAWALYKSRLVVMTGGMFNALCRLASKVCGSGAFVMFCGGKEPEWKPDLESTFEPVIKSLAEGFFDWEAETSSWREAPQRQWLFLYVLQTLARFVVLHELGHMHHNHGSRFIKEARTPIEIDAVGPSSLTAGEAISSQARELIADRFAFFRLTEIIKAELSIRDRSSCSITNKLSNDLLRNDAEITQFALSIVYLYFHMMDGKDWYSKDCFVMSHPPSPFRLKSLFANVAENGLPGYSKDKVYELLSATSAAATALTSVVHNHYPSFNWMECIGTQKFDRLYKDIYNELGNWINRPSSSGGEWPEGQSHD